MMPPCVVYVTVYRRGKKTGQHLLLHGIFDEHISKFSATCSAETVMNLLSGNETFTPHFMESILHSRCLVPAWISPSQRRRTWCKPLLWIVMAAFWSVPIYSMYFLIHQSPSELEVKLTPVTADENTNCLQVGHKKWKEKTGKGAGGGESDIAEFILKLNWVSFTGFSKGIKYSNK